MADDRDTVDKKFDPVKTGDLTDETGLYGEFRAFRAEMRTAFELLTIQFLPFVAQAREEIADLKERVSLLEASGRRRTKR